MLTRDCRTIFDLLRGTLNTHSSYLGRGLWISRVQNGVKEFNDTQCRFNFSSSQPGYQVHHLSLGRKKLEWPSNFGLRERGSDWVEKGYILVVWFKMDSYKLARATKLLLRIKKKKKKIKAIDLYCLPLYTHTSLNPTSPQSVNKK